MIAERKAEWTILRKSSQNKKIYLLYCDLVFYFITLAVLQSYSNTDYKLYLIKQLYLWGNEEMYLQCHIGFFKTLFNILYIIAENSRILEMFFHLHLYYKHSHNQDYGVKLSLERQISCKLRLLSQIKSREVK